MKLRSSEEYEAELLERKNKLREKVEAIKEQRQQLISNHPKMIEIKSSALKTK
jgi:hypothetical protein